jgi:hypothetical protein
MEPSGLMLNSQELSTCSYPEPDQSSPHHPSPRLEDPSYVLVFLVVSFPLAFPLVTYTRSYSPLFELHAVTAPNFMELMVVKTYERFVKE